MLFALKRDLSKLQDEKLQLQLKLDETHMHLDTANFKLDSLQLTSGLNSATTSTTLDAGTRTTYASSTSLAGTTGLYNYAGSSTSSSFGVGTF